MQQDRIFWGLVIETGVRIVQSPDPGRSQPYSSSRVIITHVLCQPREHRIVVRESVNLRLPNFHDSSYLVLNNNGILFLDFVIPSLSKCKADLGRYIYI